MDDSGVEGWAASEYLEPVTGLRRASAEIFDQIGRLDCKPSGATTFQKCDFGVARGGPSEGAMMVYLPGDHRNLLDYQAGRLVVSDGETEVDAEVQVIDTGLRVTVSHSVIEMPLAPFLSEITEGSFPLQLPDQSSSPIIGLPGTRKKRIQSIMRSRPLT